MICFTRIAIYCLKSQVGITIASLPTDKPSKEILKLAGIVSWLILVGLILLLIDGILLLLKRRKPKESG